MGHGSFMKVCNDEGKDDEGESLGLFKTRK